MGLTGAIFKGLTFDGEDSKNYGVYITGQAVYNSPERDVEMISIPGRDGAFALDRGRFSNIEVTYPAGLFGVDAADFAQAIADFRNMLGSRVGYCRLEDDYNPGEYREAIFKAGLEVTPASLESGQFDIVFECKPQRWLTSGEAAVALSSGDTITNPTLFDARPMLQVWGYGNFTINGEALSVFNVPVGRIKVSDTRQTNGGLTLSVDINDQYADPGDRIEYDKGYYEQVSLSFAIGYPGVINSATSSDTGHMTASVGEYGSAWVCSVDLENQFSGMRTPFFNYGTSALYTGTATFTLDTSGGTKTIDISLSVVYDGVKNITATWSYTASADISLVSPSFSMLSWYLESSQSALGSPLFFDLDIGEAYKIENDVPVSINNAVTIPAILPTLPPGATSITYDNTITQFKVVPRWWKL